MRAMELVRRNLKEAVRDPGGGGVKVQFTSLNVQASLDVTGELAAAAALTWGELTHSGDEVEVQKVAAREGLVLLPTGPRASFRPVRPSGYVPLPYSGLVAHGCQRHHDHLFHVALTVGEQRCFIPFALPVLESLSKGWYQ